LKKTNILFAAGYKEKEGKTLNRKGIRGRRNIKCKMRMSGKSE
jgi:hypothetical protein